MSFIEPLFPHIPFHFYLLFSFGLSPTISCHRIIIVSMSFEFFPKFLYLSCAMCTYELLIWNAFPSRSLNKTERKRGNERRAEGEAANSGFLVARNILRPQYLSPLTLYLHTFSSAFENVLCRERKSFVKIIQTFHPIVSQ